MDASWVRRGTVWVASVAVVLLAAMLSMADDDDAKPDDNPYLPREGLSALSSATSSSACKRPRKPFKRSLDLPKQLVWRSIVCSPQTRRKSSERSA